MTSKLHFLISISYLFGVRHLRFHRYYLSLQVLDYFIIIYSLRVFHIGVSGLSFTGVWVTASLHKSPGFLFSILALLNNAVLWTVSTSHPISKSSSPLNNPLVTVPKAPITIGIMVTFMFHSFFQFPRKVQVLILLFIFFQFYSVVSRDSEVHNFVSSLFLMITIRSGLLAEISWFVSMSKSHRSLCVSFSRTDARLYHLFVWSNLNFLQTPCELLYPSSRV